MDINRDEIRRQLDDTARAQREALPRWKDAVREALDAPHGADDTAGLLSVPNRRGFLRIGGLTIAGATLMAACTPAPETVQLAQTGETPSTPTTQIYEPEGDIATDLTLIRVAQSIEKLAIAAYDAAIASGLLDTAVADAAKLFQSHHTAHFAVLREAITALGGESFEEANPVLAKALVDPVAEAIKGGTAKAITVLTLAHDLEDAAAQTYTNSVAMLTTADLRQTMMAIGGVEARHVAVLLGAMSPGNAKLQVPFTFEKTAGAVKPRSEAYVAVGTGREVTSTTAAPRATPSTRAATGTTGRAGGTATTTTTR